MTSQSSKGGRSDALQISVHSEANKNIICSHAPRDLISLCDTRAPEDTKCYFASTELDLFIIIHEIASIWKF